MRLASKGGMGFFERQSFYLFRVRKRLGQVGKYESGAPKKLLFIVGCQRSGTTLLHHIFRLDHHTATYDEFSRLSREDTERLGLDPREKVMARIATDRPPLIVAKPLVESQNVRDILDWAPEARAIWIYRDFRDVAASNPEYFGGDKGHRDLAHILATDDANWRLQNMDPDDVEKIRTVYTPDIGPHDAAALFWWARNSLFFSRACHEDERVALCRYFDLVNHPGVVMRRAYDFVGRPYPGDHITQDVVTDSAGRGRDIPLSDGVRDMCEALLARLDASPGMRIDLRQDAAQAQVSGL